MFAWCVCVCRQAHGGQEDTGVPSSIAFHFIPSRQGLSSSTELAVLLARLAGQQVPTILFLTTPTHSTEILSAPDSAWLCMQVLEI